MKDAKDAKKENEIEKLQQCQQQLQILMIQKQNMQVQLNEIENALAEIVKGDKSEVYEMVGTIMIKKKFEDVKKSLEEKQEAIKLRNSFLDNQTEKLNAKMQELQKSFKK